MFLIIHKIHMHRTTSGYNAQCCALVLSSLEKTINNYIDIMIFMSVSQNCTETWEPRCLVFFIFFSFRFASLSFFLSLLNSFNMEQALLINVTLCNQKDILDCMYQPTRAELHYFEHRSRWVIKNFHRIKRT